MQVRVLPSSGRELDVHQFIGEQNHLFLLKDLAEAMEMMESQTLLLTLLTVKVRREPRSRAARVEGDLCQLQRQRPLSPERSFFT